MNNIYNFQEVENKIKSFWQSEGIFKFNPDKQSEKIYSLDTPPPTISGKMHVGHAFSYSQQDFIMRYKRMNGEVFYPFGTDDNGLPTERLVERIKNVKSKEMSRDDFIKLCTKTIDEVKEEFIEQWKILGISADFSNYYSTISNESRRLSQKSFIDLYNKGEIYKSEVPMIWCCECQTSIAQAELEDKELPSKFSTLKFKIKSTNEDLLIATTRPELLGACVCIMINPNDKRYSKILGETAIVPLFNQEVLIYSDEGVSIDKGTGVLMVCSYGDKYDVDIIRRFNLKQKIVLNKDGTVVYEKYKGQKIKEARRNILEDLERNGFIHEQKDILHNVNTHERCGSEIEFLPTKQWFIKVIDKKNELIKKGNEIKWFPEYMHQRYNNWVNGLEWDWNVSRNRHFGIPIPIWECEKCHEIILPKEEELPIDPLIINKNCPICKSRAIPEDMVLDTWATSSISPKIANNLFGTKIKYPFSLRAQGHDIIRTWAFYTIARSLMSDNQIPWKDIVISGNVSMGGEKMTKSKGNVIDPEVVIEKYGSDALRYWASGSNLGNDLDYQEDDLKAGKKMVNKLWNSSKFVFMNLTNYTPTENIPELMLLDKLLLQKMNLVIEKATNYWEVYEYSKAKQEVEIFFWQDFTDNYLEIVKKRIYQGNEEEKKSAQHTLYIVLLNILKLLSPITPFITEEIYQLNYRKYEKIKSIHISKWPDVIKMDEYDNLEKLNILYDIVANIRREKTFAKKSMNSKIQLTLEKKVYDSIKNLLPDLKDVSNAGEVKVGNKFLVEFID